MTLETAEQLALYRHLITLQNGMRVLLRPLVPKDRDALVGLFASLPLEEISYFRSAVANPSLVSDWAENVDYGRVFPLVAVVGDRIVGNSTLHLGGSHTRHVAEIRIFLAREFRRCGIGKSMLKSQIEIARRMGLRQLIAEIVENQPQVIHAFEDVGFERVAALKDMFMTPDGDTLDMIMLVNYLKRSADEF